ncbi:MAG TPA: PP2C family protein-serine/threonine phosphatase [Actinophytocola sp.]|uniref:PP2C family protein-serine/threonine phosphatase n=1 Tax=Actinophytocola sp. TaxID=1872138 RepID=UPI002DB66A09|nr:PP2C family protein-serine/threonine phosphatase [Actinophytocola sp.]HEU5472432.1 PP2C family protein-serine/threonine phosphatase [Actinophytocola sp.]
MHRAEPAAARPNADERDVGEAWFLSFLADAGGRLVGTFDLDSAATMVVELAVPTLADCAVLVLPDVRGRLDWWRWSRGRCTRGRIRRPTVDAAPTLTAGLDGLKRVGIMPPAEVEALPPAFAEPLMRYPDVAVVSLPAVADAPPPGVLLLARPEPPQPLHSAETEARTVAEFAERVSRAVHGAAEFDRHRAASIELQSTLRPPALPVLPGVRLSAIYRPAAGPVDVGGDFYDLHPQPDGSTLFTLGDVCGNGAEAAALSGRVRHALAALRLVENDPLTLLTLLNQALLGVSGSKFATAVLGTITRRSGGSLHLRMSSGGHPSPLILRANGTVEVIAIPGMLVGIMPQAQFGETTVELAPQDTCILYTDGITEARGGEDGEELFGSERLRTALSFCQGRQADQVATHIDQTIQHWSNNASRDDIALLAIQSTPTP